MVFSSFQDLCLELGLAHENQSTENLQRNKQLSFQGVMECEVIDINGF